MSDPKKGLKPPSGGDMERHGLGAADVTEPDGQRPNPNPAVIGSPPTEMSGHSRSITDDSLFVPGDPKKQFIPPSASGCLRKAPSKLSRYYCKYCGKLFNKNCDLSRHKRIHTGERPYTCQLCVMAFARKDVMHLHMRKHHMVDMTGHEKYTCLKCQARFSGTDDLKSHVLSHEESGVDPPSGSGPPRRAGAKKVKKARGQPKASSTSKSAGFNRSKDAEGPNVKVCNTSTSRPERENAVGTHGGSRCAEPSAQLPGGEAEEREPLSSSRFSVYRCKHCQKHFHKYCTLLRHQRTSHKEKGACGMDLSKSPCSESVDEDIVDIADTVTADNANYQEQSESSRERVKPKEAVDTELENTAVNLDSIDFAEHPRPSSSVSSPSIDWYSHSPSLVNRSLLPQEQNFLTSNSFPCDCNFCRSCEANPYLVHGPVASQHLCSPRTPDLCSPVSNRFHHMHDFCRRSANFISSSRLAQIYDSNACLVGSPLVSPCQTFQNVYMHHSGVPNACVNFNPCHNGRVYCSSEVCCHGPLAKYPKYEVIPSSTTQNPLCNNLLSRGTFREDVLVGREPVCSSRGCRCMAQVPVKQETVENPGVVKPHQRRSGLVGGTPSMTSPVVVIKEEPKVGSDCRRHGPLENHWTDTHNARRKPVIPCLGYLSAENRHGDFGHVYNGAHAGAMRPNSGRDTYTHKPMERDYQIHDIHPTPSPALSPQEEQVSPNNYATPSIRRSAFSAYNRDRNSTADNKFSPGADEFPQDRRIPPTTSVRGVQPLGKLFSSGDNGESVQGTSYQNTAPRYDMSPEDMDEFVASSITTVVKDNNQKVYQCNICKKCLSQKGDLKRHLKIHLGQKDFICLFCSRGFIKNSDLQRHIRTRHTREKPYECSQCLRKYARTDQLLDHMRMHLGDKRFECEMCHEKFLRRYELQKHVREHYQSNKKGDAKFKTEPPDIGDDEVELDVVKIEEDYSTDDDDAVPNGEVEHDTVTMVTSDKESELAATPEIVNVVDELEIAVESHPSRSSPCPDDGGTLSPGDVDKRNNLDCYYPHTKTDCHDHSCPSPETDCPVQSGRADKIDYPVQSIEKSDNPVRPSASVKTNYPVLSNPIVKADNLGSGRSNHVVRTDSPVHSHPVVKATCNNHDQHSPVPKAERQCQSSFVKTVTSNHDCPSLMTDYPSQSSSIVKTPGHCCSTGKTDYSGQLSSVVKTDCPYHLSTVVKSDDLDPSPPGIKTDDQFQSCPVLMTDNPAPPCFVNTDNVAVLQETFSHSDSSGTKMIEFNAKLPQVTEWTDKQEGKGLTCFIKKEGLAKRHKKVPAAKKPRRPGQNVCQTCCRTFSQRGDLKRHMKIHTGQRDFVCTYCPKAFIKRSDLKRHLLVHTQEKPYSCEFCGTRYSRKDQLQTHINRRCSKKKGFEPKQMPNSTRPSNSPTVGNTPDGNGHTSSTALQTSPGFVSIEGPVQAWQRSDQKCNEFGLRIVDYECADKLEPCTSMPNESSVISSNDVSEKTDCISKREQSDASDSRAVQPDVVVKSGRRPSTADSKQVGQIVSRNLHQFPCKHCEKRFLTKTKLQIHLMTHTHIIDAEAPLERYKCTECSLCFADRDLLDNHTVVVHRVLKPYVCGYCSETFVNGGELEVHIAEHRSGLS